MRAFFILWALSMFFVGAEGVKNNGEVDVGSAILIAGSQIAAAIIASSYYFYPDKEDKKDK